MLLIAAVLPMAMFAQQIVIDNNNTLRVDFRTELPVVGEVTLEGQTFATLDIEGYLPVESVGTPAFPVFSRLIEVPLCDDFKVEVTDAVYDTLKPLSHLLVPAQPSRSKSDTTKHALAFNKEVYSWNAFIREPMAKVEAVGIARDRRLARLQFAPVSYNPVTGQVMVCRKATVTVNYVNPDVAGTRELFNRYYSPAFSIGDNTLNSLYPKSVSNSAPVRYLIVANSMFRGYMDDFVQWKRRKGFLTDIVYTDEATVGTTTTSIKAYIQNQYTNATATNPAPTYLLLVGDVAQLPAFSGSVRNSHATDLYYSTWTSGDSIPDCYYGRFSAQNVEQLMPQIQKTLMYEQYTFADPTFLDRAIMVAGVDGGSSGDYGYTHGDPAMDYGVTNYFNGAHGFSSVRYFKNNTSIVPQGVTNVTVASNGSSNAATIRNYYNQGAGFINYSAHGSPEGWYSPSFTTTHVPSMTNTQKFGLMIGNCCQTNTFDDDACFGEALLRKDNYCGAVGYIGGSQVTYWNEDFYWAVGVRSNIGASMSMAYDANNLGVYDRSFHTHNEAYSDWAITQGAVLMFGNLAVQASGSSLSKYYWEIYHLMGDPSVMTYLTQASVMTVSAPSSVPQGTSTLNVTAAPYAYVALTNPTTHTVLTAAWANANGLATLSLPSNITVGTYEIAASAQQYRTAFQNITIINPNGAYVLVPSVTPSAPLAAGDTVTLSIVFANTGNVTAQGVTAHLESSSPMLTLLTDSLTLGTIAANGQVVNNAVQAVVSPLAADNTSLTLTATINWTGNSNPAVSILPLTLVAPVPVLVLSNSNFVMLPGGTTAFTATLRNAGHAPMQAARLAVDSPTPLVTVTPATTATVTLAPGDSLTAQFTIAADNQMPLAVYIPLTLTRHSANGVATEALSVYVGTEALETFDGGFQYSGWTQGALPWIIDNTTVYSGTHSARSASGMSNNSTSMAIISCTYLYADSISFYYKVSSESGYDKFHFLIDNTEMISSNNSGEVDWTRVSFPVAAGTHTYKFSYVKDRSVSNGSDCAWIDNVTMPRDVRNVTFRSVDTCYAGTEALPAFTVAADSSVTFYDYNIFTAYSTRDTVVGCDSCVWNGNVYTASITFADTLTAINQCDSIIALDIVVHPSVSDTVTYICNLDSYTWNDSVYTVDGEYSQLFSTLYGCDSTVTLILTFDSTYVGINAVDGTTVAVYPNPTANTVHFSRDVDEAVLYDLNGRQLAHRSSVRSIDMGTLPSGTYVLRLTIGGATATCRVVRQ